MYRYQYHSYEVDYYIFVATDELKLKLSLILASLLRLMLRFNLIDYNQTFVGLSLFKSIDKEMWIMIGFRSIGFCFHALDIFKLYHSSFTKANVYLLNWCSLWSFSMRFNGDCWRSWDEIDSLEGNWFLLFVIIRKEVVWNLWIYGGSWNENWIAGVCW